ncbi:hypothetical protein ACUHGC_03325 [Testudinibacter sp. P27/CKL/0425]
MVMLRVLLLFVGVGLLFYSSRQNTGAGLSLSAVRLSWYLPRNC